MFEGLKATDWTAGGLLAVAILLMFFGRLIPRPTYDEKVKEAERWRLAYEAEREARETATQQTAELLEYAKLSHQLLEAILGESEKPPRKGGAHRVVQTSQQ